MTGRNRSSATGTGKRTSQQNRSLYARLLPVSTGASATSSASPPPTLFTARYDAELGTVWLDLNPATSTASHADNLHLWHAGFFGKGTLSRSEPTWHTRTLASVQLQRARDQGRLGTDKLTPEEMTAWRRRERIQAKIERARLAVKAGTMLKDGIIALGGELDEEDEDTAAQAAANADDADAADEGYRTFVPGLIHLRPSTMQGKVPESEIRQSLPATSTVSQASLDDIRPAEDGTDDDIDIVELERMQLSLQETFFLAGMLGVLVVTDHEGHELDIEALYHASLRSSLSLADRRTAAPQAHLRPDNPFLVHYIAYHHFRSLGWVVKSGLKFCVDLLLYKRGPVFSHAEFAVLVVPVYEDPADANSSPFDPALLNLSGELDWIKFHTFNRVNTQVLKTLILAHVRIPALSRTPPSHLSTAEEMVRRLRAGELWSVYEVSIRRWSPARMRP